MVIGIVNNPRSKTLIDQIDIESRIAGKATPSTTNDPLNFNASCEALTNSTEQLHCLRDIRQAKRRTLPDELAGWIHAKP